MNVVIERVAVHRLEIPLTQPYRLAFGPITHYDTVIVDIALADGRTGFGEATLLTGYTDETIGDAVPLACEIACELPGTGCAAAGGRLARIGRRAPFVAGAFQTALDMATAHPLLEPAPGTRVPLLGLLQGRNERELRDNAERLLDEGYRTLKVKVGFDVPDDLAALSRMQAIVAGRAPLRVDANQGYSADEAASFIRSVDPRGIELFEQPCGAGDWAAHRGAVEAAARTGLPLMLDESIYGLADIERAAREGACRFVKLKLMKLVGLDPLVAAIERIRALGMTPVLGNGVAADPSCWMEACVAARCIDNAGEMNGFLKPAQRLFVAPLRFDRGAIVLDGGTPALDADALRAVGREHHAFH